MTDLSLELQLQKSIRELEQDPQPRKWPAEAAELLVVHPEKYLQVVRHLCDGDSVDKVAKAMGIGKPAVRAIVDRHALLHEQTTAIKRLLHENVHLTLEQVSERHDEISPNKYGFLIDMLVKSGQLVSGGPTTRHEMVHVSSPDDLEKMFKQLPSANEPI